MISFSRKRTADKEYIEFYECEQVMNEELCEEYKKVERIVAHQVGNMFYSWDVFKSRLFYRFPENGMLRV